MNLYDWILIGMLFAFVFYKLKQYSACIARLADWQHELLDEATRPGLGK